VILTVSTNVLTSGKLRLEPELPKRHMEGRHQAQAGQAAITWRWN